MTEIKVGEYVRTMDGKIGIFVRYSSRKDDSLYKSPANCFIRLSNRKSDLQCFRDYIVKHSPNIIDLIEEGDYVNGELVTGFGYEDVNGAKEKSILVEGKYTKVSFALLEWDIKSIVTKEMFLDIEYRLED